MITRKAFGGAYDVMGSKHLGADINVAWPTAQIAVMGAQGAVNILHRKEIAKADDAEAARARAGDGVRGHPASTPYIAAERGYVDSVIPPSRDPLLRHPCAADAAQQAPGAAAEEAREHPAVSDACGASGPGSGSMSNLRIVRGDPTPEDLAALTALVSVAGGDADEPDPPARGRWNDPTLAAARDAAARAGRVAFVVALTQPRTIRERAPQTVVVPRSSSRYSNRGLVRVR